MLLALLCVLLLVPSVAAQDAPIEDTVPVVFSEDYTPLTLDGVGYSRVNTTLLDYEYYDTTPVYAEYIFSETQKAAVDWINTMQYGDHAILTAEIYFNDGAMLTASFLRDDLRAEFDRLVSGQTDTYVIDFRWPGDNTVTIERETLFGEEVTLSADELSSCTDFSVKAQSEDGVLRMVTGHLLMADDAFYYADIERSQLFDGYFDADEYTELTVWEITDPALLEQLTEAKQRYEDDLALFSGDLTVFFSYAALILVFVLLPLAVAVLGWILFARSKKLVYRKLCLVVALLATIELVIVVLTCLCNTIPG